MIAAPTPSFPESLDRWWRGEGSCAVGRRQPRRFDDIGMRKRSGRPLLVMGDMNTAYQDATRDVGLLAATLGLHAFEPQERRPTYPISLPFVRFDWVLASPELSIVACTTLSEVVSDHAAVVADVVLQ
jgi:endonuclease/exonuclease/phosphatase family metal-dependent hydrolase